MIRHLTLALTALFGGILLGSQAVQAQQTVDAMGGLTINTTPAVVSDYSFRGISQTRLRPAAQATVDIEHASGFYIGAFASNVAFAGTNARMEIDGLAGYRFAIGDLKLDIGGIYYGYPGYDAPRGGYNLDFFEAALRTSYEIAPVKLVGLLTWSPNYNLESGNAIYLEGGVDVALDFGFTVSARGGYQWIERNARWGAADYYNFSFGFSREIAGGFIGSVTGILTSLDQRRECFGGAEGYAKNCDNRVILGISRPF